MKFNAFHRQLWRVACIPLLIAALAGIYWCVLQLIGNFHTVVPNEVYRAAQIDAEDIRHYQEKYNIRSIINLRGENVGKSWYDNEINAVKAANIHFINFRMAAKHELSSEEANQLVETIHNAPKPTLIHCQSGSDRTGLASALYLAVVEKRPEAEAKHQLSLFYGHFSLPFTKEYAMDRTFEKMRPQLGYDKR